jgi:hypothetical protein
MTRIVVAIGTRRIPHWLVPSRFGSTNLLASHPHPGHQPSIAPADTPDGPNRGQHVVVPRPPPRRPRRHQRPHSRRRLRHPGGFLTTLATHRPDLTRFAIDWDQSAARRATTKSATAITRGSVNTLPFDAAISADVLCHQAGDPPTALKELHRVLRPRGRVILNLPAYRWPLSAHDRRVQNIRRFTAAAPAPPDRLRTSLDLISKRSLL